MFSPTLISVMVHNLPLGVIPTSNFNDTRQIAVSLYDFVSNQDPSFGWSAIPISGRTNGIDFNRWFQSYVEFDSGKNAAFFFWGRVPVNLLVIYLNEYFAKPAEEEYIDFAPAIQPAGSGSKYDTACSTYLGNTAGSRSAAELCVAIVDLGNERKGASPDDYSGRLHHAVTTDIEMADHAERVLSVLLERLDRKAITTKNNVKVISETTVSCALVRPAPASIVLGNNWFAQESAVEMHAAVKALDAHLANWTKPVVTNISLGTHIGPHNGNSPLEEYIVDKLVDPPHRFVVAAAGNDGGKGRSAKRFLSKDEQDFLSVTTGPNCKQLLIELWWEATNEADLAVAVNIFQVQAAGGLARLGAISIDKNSKGVLTVDHAGLLGHMTASSLFDAKCHNNFSCVTFALSTTRTVLPALRLQFGLKATDEAVVNAWIVVQEPGSYPQTTFIEGGPDGTVMVPASDLALLSVAGVDANKNIWQGSSRGPAAQYQSTRVTKSSPLMSHLAELDGEYGTSYASPRACADAAETLLDPAKNAANCNNAENLIYEMYNLIPPQDWNSRSGLRKQDN